MEKKYQDLLRSADFQDEEEFEQYNFNRKNKSKKYEGGMSSDSEFL